MKRVVSIFLIIVLVMSIFASNAYCSELHEGTKIKLYDIYVTVPYDENDVDVVYEISDVEVRAIISDAKTGKILEVHGEYIQSIEELPEEILNEFPIDIKLRAVAEKTNKRKVSATAGGYFNKVVYKDKIEGPCTARLYCDFKYYSEYNYRNLVSINSTYWREASSGDWILERETSNAQIVDPATLLVYGGANITVTTTQTTTGEFSVDFLEGLGYSVSHASGNLYYARTTIDDFRYSYSLY